MRFSRPRMPARGAAPTDGVPRGFWGAVGYGMTLWMLRRAVFLLACGALGAVIAPMTHNGGMLDGALWGVLGGFALLIVWFALANIIF